VKSPFSLLRQHLVVRRDFFNDLRALLRYMLFDNWNHLMRFMLIGLELIHDTCLELLYSLSSSGN
jgi:hypothetical protein